MPYTPPANHTSRPVVVLGGGVLGRRIAACFVSAGYHVRIRDPSDKSRNDALAYIKENISSFLALSHGKQGTYEALADLPAAVKDAWLVFEAVPEILSIKEDTFADLEKYAPEDCILASNSSSYKSGELVGKVSDETKARVLNTHYMMPPQAIIVELMTSGYTDEGIFPFLVQEHKKAGLHPVVAQKESTGFIFNRIWAAIKREVLAVIMEGVADADTIDKIWQEQYSSPVGPCRLMDKVGLDTVEHIEQHYVQDRKLPSTTLEWLRNNFIEPGKLGDKSNKGGLYPAPAPGTRTKILVLNWYQGTYPGEITLPQHLNKGEVLEISADARMAGRPIALLSGQNMPDGIDACDDRMYWTCMGVPSANDGTVYSAKLDGSDLKTLIPVGKVHTPKQLHIDQENKKVYFCDREGLRVHRCDLDGSQHEIIIQTGDWEVDHEKVADQKYWCVGIAVSHKLNTFYWTQKGPSKGTAGRIFSASIDMPAGSDATTRKDIRVVADNLPEPIDLEVDDDEGVLYWTDRGEIPLGNTLNKKQIVGKAPKSEGTLGREIIAQGFGEAIGLRIDKQKQCIYVADLAGRLWQCSTTAAPKEKIFEAEGHCYTGLTFMRY
ncbi:hypothetical protein LTR56_015980 [Elasticomyces elasticus]|nr:hypothetical protein LTR56_015980 [Elasticomyces elasticus]KAK4917942.1 hypothetical protein LTR49_014217 [Elasticomyces elasticus]KAK5753339.1 hypothetical protein LTS12_016582 [Elasticomyces elasticus]